MQQPNNRKFLFLVGSAVIGITILAIAASFAIPRVQQIQQDAQLKDICGKPDMLVVSFTPSTLESDAKQILSQEKLTLAYSYTNIDTYVIKIDEASQPRVIEALSIYPLISSVNKPENCSN